jgi:hypothetical protein
VATNSPFFTDAYDLFVIGIASALITKDWHLSSGQLAVLNSTMLAAAFLGALVFGRYADVVGRKRVYWLVAAIMIAGALGSALSGSFWDVDRVPFRTWLRCRRRLPGQRGHGERVREPEGPRQAGRDGVRHAGARADRRAADRWPCSARVPVMT